MASNFWSLLSLRKGLNDTDPPHAINDEQCTVATNVEFNLSTLGERRNGCVDVDLPTSITGDANIQAITFLHRHLPTGDETASELWVLGMHLTSQNFLMTRKTTSWTTATFTDDIEVTGAQGFKVAAQTLHGKLFLAYPSVGGVDRLHVVDTSGTAVRRTGLAEPAAPTAAETGSGTFSGVRYYRQRYTVQSGGVTLRRSEPSDSVMYDPAGGGSNGASARVTKSASISESETHWELEASTDDSNFYVIATTVVGTTTVDDSVVYATGYAASYTLSEDIGDYALLHSGKFLATDEDRLLIGGSWEDSALASRVSWTPVLGDPGDGNDERSPIDTDNYIDLDGLQGGGLTALHNPVNGYVTAFKWSAVYRLVRTGVRTRAYNAFPISKSYGALPGSVVEGTDGAGRPCLYALDPNKGPYRLGEGGLQSASRDIMTTWRTVNTDAIIVSRAVYDVENNIVRWWIATGSSNYPDLEILLHTKATIDSPDGVRFGWATATGKIARVYAVCTYAEDIDDNNARSLYLTPFIGVTAADGYVLRTGTGSDDNGTAFAARIVTKPFYLKGLLAKFKILAAALLATADDDAEVKVTLIRDGGIEEPKTVTTDLAAVGSETQVIKQLRNLVGSQFYCAQIEFEDTATPAGQWRLHRFDARISSEETA